MVTTGMARLRRIMMEVETGARHLPLLAKETIAELYERMLTLDSKVTIVKRNAIFHNIGREISSPDKVWVSSGRTRLAFNFSDVSVILCARSVS